MRTEGFHCWHYAEDKLIENPGVYIVRYTRHNQLHTTCRVDANGNVTMFGQPDTTLRALKINLKRYNAVWKLVGET